METGTLNPYTYQGDYQKYFINTGDYIKGITGMHKAESELLLRFLRSQLDDPNIQVRWHYEPNDVVVWDERCTNHRALSDHFPSRRLVRRCTVGAGIPLGVR